MTIEKIKEIASDYLNDKESTSEMEELFDEFIQIKEKYQKIEQILDNKDYEWGNTSTRLTALNEIKRVVEDGNDNCD